ncbi:Si-specific NAD(P)(+) transhydrogenase [Agarilytica rhodophyticola]|uniref:Si-specific NAD(P)(+) transhydrogenase n=1 Tax=Agarilytica rhodophyticola TaxID=1737490 RepID=UPI000B3441BE|nr:Si-specific NAD(P)(+) transhydrogenase [Agarilytica rhodophyticola]
MADYRYDLVVIGAGPAGESAAIAGAKNNMRVCVVEDRGMLGGNCTHKGTIPSKALRNAVKQIIHFGSQPIFRSLGNSKTLSYPQVLEAASQVIPQQVKLHTEYLLKNRINVHNGRAKFIGNNQVEVKDHHGTRDIISAQHFVITTGSRPYHPSEVDFSHPRIYDSDTILEMKHTPRTLIIFGAGVIGCEYASIFAGMGIKVDLINGRERLLSFLDDEISDALSYHLRDNGVMVRHSEEHESVEASDNGVLVKLKSGKRIKADALLWCNGRTGNTDGLGLDSVDLEANHRGQLKVDKNYRTEVDNIYAAGDVIGWPSLASASYDQGRAVIDAILGREARFIEDAPTGIYTLPEISSVGKTEAELTAAKIPYEVGRAFFKDTARGQISGEDVGMLKLLFHIDTLEILGIHCFGAEATEIVHIGQAVMSQPEGANNVEYFVKTTFNYPTMAEAYRVASLNGLNRLHRHN